MDAGWADIRVGLRQPSGYVLWGMGFRWLVDTLYGLRGRRSDPCPRVPLTTIEKGHSTRDPSTSRPKCALGSPLFQNAAKATALATSNFVKFKAR
ncbi:hypothetical protein TWF694_001659 [Orbilia ellipsospora]|uniref:Uncharacterized protein n=1 Tax=Orbilia ellipsospora TaxID=2528407 RepID=A0AAV9X4D1_9PEZI